MGWSSGSSLFNSVIKVIKPNIADKKKRVEIYKELIVAFVDSDWDTLDECLGADDAYDEAVDELYPDLLDD